MMVVVAVRSRPPVVPDRSPRGQLSWWGSGSCAAGDLAEPWVRGRCRGHDGIASEEFHVPLADIALVDDLAKPGALVVEAFEGRSRPLGEGAIELEE